MASFSADTLMSLRAQINGTVILMNAETLPLVLTSLDNFRYVYGLTEGDIRIAIATHDDLYWAIVTARNRSEYVHAIRGHNTEREALQHVAQYLSDEVWKMAKENNVPLPK
jgi:Xaa-Pro aminopeptidase